jgi:hypothetical protein
MLRKLVATAALTSICTMPSLAEGATALYLDRVVEIDSTLADPNDLWVLPADLTRINDFELKPEGACLDDLCVPVKQDRDSNIFVRRDQQGWFNVSELARRLEQASVFDADARAWSFGVIPATRRDFLERGIAPDFTLPDRNGNPVRLSDFRGKKVMILSWASW